MGPDNLLALCPPCQPQEDPELEFSSDPEPLLEQREPFLSNSWILARRSETLSTNPEIAWNISIKDLISASQDSTP